MKLKNAAAILTLVLIAAGLGGFHRVWAQRDPGDPALSSSYRDWKVYGGGRDNIHYSALDQINRSNVQGLKQVWSYESGDAFPDSLMECNPIVEHGTLYAVTPRLRLVALDAATGKLQWSFDPDPDEKKMTEQVADRGVAYWEDGNDRRIFHAARHYLYAIDASTGKPLPDFGQSGRVDLREGLGRNPSEQYVEATTPGVVYKDLLIMGDMVAEDLPASPGDIRAYDVRTGKIRWSFHTIPHPGEYGYDTWLPDSWQHSGGANAWAGLSLDEKRGLVFAATGSAAFDFYGADRVGDDLFANCVIALRADTGERVWHFQGVKHDVWDRDFPAAPALVTVQRGGRHVDAVAQTTKAGFVFVLDRETGAPLFPVEYRQVPASDVDGEVLATSQPFPLLPPPFARQEFTEDLVTNRTPEAHRAVLEQLRKLRHGGQFDPPSREGTVMIPGMAGGGEWGGPAFDPGSDMLYVNANEIAHILRLKKRPLTKADASTKTIYLARCAGCHRENMEGSPPTVPSLVKVGAKYSPTQIQDIITQGRGRMPSFQFLGLNATEAMAQFLATGKDTEVVTPVSEQPAHPLKYSFDGYAEFLDPEGYPASTPPWGTLNAINLDSGEIAWKIPLGEYPELAAKGLHDTGDRNYGGPLVTAGGLLFIGATDRDRKFRAYDKASGKLLWETVLPASGSATPATYEVGGRQFVVIAAGGGRSGSSPSGGSYVAFALPGP